MAAANAVGGKMPMFVIGKSSKPRCFKERQIFTLPIQKSTKELEGWGLVWRVGARNFAFQEKSIALVIDNCPASIHIEK